MFLSLARRGASHDRANEAAFVLDGVDRSSEENRRSLLPADVRHPLPHLPGSKSRIAKFVDQRGDDLAAIPGSAARDEGAAQNEPEVEALDALSRPVGGELLGADAPYLFCVRLEEDAEEAPSKLVAHPVLEALRILDRLQPRTGIAGDAAHGFQRPQVPERVGGFDRIGEEASPVIDAREPPAGQHLVAEDLGPQVFDLLVLGEEPVAADVESITLVLDGAGQTAYLPGILLEDRDRDVVLEKLVGGSQPRRARAHDDDVRPTALGDQSAHSVATSPAGSVLLVSGV